MIVKKNKYGFKSIYYILENVDNVVGLKKDYARVSVYSYDKLKLNDFTSRSKKTPLIYLNKSIEEIFSKFNSTTRKKIRRFEREEDLKIILEDDNVDKAYSIYKEHSYSYGSVPESKEDLKGLILFSAYYKNEMIAAIFCYNAPEFLRAKVICSKTVDRNKKEEIKIIANANCALVWKIVNYCKEKNYRAFDLGSINTTDEARGGAVQFKMGFGAEIIDEYYYVYKNIVYEYFEKLVALKILFFRMMNKLREYVKK